MEARTFNSKFPKFNEQWTSNVLGIPTYGQNGPDLLNENIFAEVKFRGIDKRDYKIWCVLEHQVKYSKNFGIDGVWAFGTYKLNQSISKLKNISDLNLGKIERELFLLDWEFIFNFEPKNSQGETKLSKWKHKLRYPKGSLFPKEMVEVGSLYDNQIVKMSPTLDISLFPNLYYLDSPDVPF